MFNSGRNNTKSVIVSPNGNAQDNEKLLPYVIRIINIKYNRMLND